MYSNQQISITGETKEWLRRALSFFADDETPRVCGYAELPTAEALAAAKECSDADAKCPRPVTCLVFFWAKPSIPEYRALPFKMGLTAAVDFAWPWLEQAERGKAPDHDGDNEKGWRVYNESWAHVAGLWEATVAVEPYWLMACK